MNQIGKYLVLDQRGSSAAGVTYRAVDPADNRELAIKVLTNGPAVNAEARNRFCARLAACAELRHRRIAGIHDLGEVDGAFFIASAFTAGPDLAHWESRDLPLDQKLRFMAQVAEGVAFAHAKGIPHGNLKPSNILAAGGADALILDFGTGEWQSLLLASGERLPDLKAYYFSPEQVLGQPFDSRSDVFSLAVILYHLVAGKHPFPVPDSLILREIVHSQPEPLRNLAPQAPELLDQLVRTAMKKDPQERLQTADEFAASLYAIARQVAPASVKPAPAIANATESMVPAIEEQIPEEPLPPVSVPAETAAAPAPAVTAVPDEPSTHAAALRDLHAAVGGVNHNKRRDRVIAITAAAVLALAIAGFIFSRQNLRASQPRARAPIAGSRASAPESARPADTPAQAATPAAPQPAAEAPKPPAPTPEAILRSQVKVLWETGNYARAMQVVDSILANDPENAEARTWKKKIRAAQQAEAEMK